MRKAEPTTLEVLATRQAKFDYRPGAIEQKKPRMYSAPLRISAPVLNLTAIASLALSLIICCACCFVRVTQIVSASGILIPKQGSIKVSSPQAGLIKDVLVREGQHVAKGTPLFTVSGEQYDASGQSIFSGSIEMLEQHVKSLEREKYLQQTINVNLRKSTDQQINAVQMELDSDSAAINTSKQMIKLDQDILGRKVGLRGSAIITIDQVEQAEVNLASEKKTIMELTASRQQATQKLETLENTKATLDAQLDLELTKLDEQISSLHVQIDSFERQKEITVIAPIDGVVASLLGYGGEWLKISQPVCVINPASSGLIAQILVPSSGVGFIRKGSRISIKYDAFPYQTFGFYLGHIISIGEVAVSLTDAEVLKVPITSNQPVFNVLASIERQDVDAYGRTFELMPGSTFTANMDGETRYIWQWILNPLLSIKGNAFSFGNDAR